MHLKKAVCLSMIFFFFMAQGSIYSSSEAIIVSIGVPAGQQYIYNDDLFNNFEAEHPGVRVATVIVQPQGFSTHELQEEEVRSNLMTLAHYVSQADILVAGSNTLSIETTRAGLYLDLAPLINSDPDLNPDDFIDAAWDSFQWDNSVWAVPFNVEPIMLIYDAVAFDTAGLTYPDASWTVSELANAASDLAVYDDSGKVVTPGMRGFELRWLFPSLLDHGFIDQVAVPNAPQLSTSDLQALLDQWSILHDTGIVQPFGEFSAVEVPMVIGGLSDVQALIQDAEDEHHWQMTLLPGGSAGINVDGYAISSGTSQPELAYQLIKYLIGQPLPSTTFPAHSSIIPEAVNPALPSFDFPEEYQASLEQGIANAMPLAEIQFYNYIRPVFETLPNLPARDHLTLEQAQVNAMHVLDIIDTWRGTELIAVVTSPVLSIQAHQTVLKFGLYGQIQPLPNREQWNQFISQFTSNEPSIGSIELLTDRVSNQEPDCYYLSSNQVPTVNLDSILDLKPLMHADPNFIEDDIMTGIMPQLERDNGIWAYPVSIQPMLIEYNSDLFEQAGIPEPSSNWTINEFIDTLHQLDSRGLSSDFAFASADNTSHHLIMLATAFDGLLIDYTTYPPSFDLTDPNNVHALQQVLDLVKEDLIMYQPAGSASSTYIGSVPMVATNFLTSAARTLSNRLNGDNTAPTRYVLFPRGTPFTPASFTIGTGYISVSSQVPEVCYRLISEIARTPELMLGIPVFRRLATDRSLESILGQDIAELSQLYASMLEDPHTIVIAAPFYLGGGFAELSFPYMWLDRAINDYVTGNVDLESELTFAQQRITEYLNCINGEENQMNSSSAPRQELFERHARCAIAVDPSLDR